MDDVFPARAGVILTMGLLGGFLGSLSRTSGGDPIIQTSNDQRPESFPHERG